MIPHAHQPRRPLGTMATWVRKGLQVRMISAMQWKALTIVLRRSFFADDGFEGEFVGDEGEAFATDYAAGHFGDM